MKIGINQESLQVILSGSGLEVETSMPYLTSKAVQIVWDCIKALWVIVTDGDMYYNN